MNASHSGEQNIPRESATFWLEGDQGRGALELLADRVRRFQSILPPPLFRGAHLRLREIRMLES